MAFLRQKGLLSVFYLDDIFLIGRTKEECVFNVETTRKLLESLGFILNLKKCNLEPSQRCKFLGFVFDSIQLKLTLPTEKIIKIFSYLKQFIIIINSNSLCKIRELARLNGILVAACPAVKYGWVYTKRIEREKFLALKRHNQNFDKKIELSRNLILDLQWWREKIKTASNSFRNSNFSIKIFSDASTSGWGAVCNGSRAHGW